MRGSKSKVQRPKSHVQCLALILTLDIDFRLGTLDLGLCYTKRVRFEGRRNEVGENFGVDDEPLERLSALPESAGGRRHQDDLFAGARRSVQPQLGADQKRLGLLRR